MITDLRTITPEECELKVVNNHSIELAGTTKRYSLLGYLSTFYLRDPSLKVIINSK